MSKPFVTINCATISGALNPDKNGEQIFVGRGTKADVSMTGHIGPPDEKGSDGKWSRNKEFWGRLGVRAAATKTGDKQYYVLDIEGGLRGVLFPTAKKGENSPDYAGNIDLDNGMQLPLFARRMQGKNGSFISISSGTAERKESSGNNASSGKSSHAQPAQDSGFEDDDIPF